MHGGVADAEVRGPVEVGVVNLKIMSGDGEEQDDNQQEQEQELEG